MPSDQTESAGQRLRQDFDDALQRESKRLGKRLTFDEHEAHALSAAAGCANRRAELHRVYADELNGQARPAMLVKLSAELRLLEKSIADHLSRVQIGVGVAKSERHQRAVNARWSRHRNEDSG